MIKVPENGQEGDQGQARAKAASNVFQSSFSKREVDGVQ